METDALTASTDLEHELRDNYWDPALPYMDAEECDHLFKRLFFITEEEDYGETIRASGVNKCFKCSTITEDGY